MDQVLDEIESLNIDSESEDQSTVEAGLKIKKRRKETYQGYLKRYCNESDTSINQNEESLVRQIVSGLPSFLQFIFAVNSLETLVELEKAFHRFDEIEAQNIGRISKRPRQTRFPNQPSKYFYRKPQSTVNPVPNTVPQPTQCSKKKSKEANLHQARKTNIVETKACFVCNCKFHFQTDCPYK
jgi:hypothetical protein